MKINWNYEIVKEDTYHQLDTAFGTIILWIAVFVALIIGFYISWPIMSSGFAMEPHTCFGKNTVCQYCMHVYLKENLKKTGDTKK